MSFERCRSVGGLLIAAALIMAVAGCGLNRSPEERIAEALAYEQSGEYRAAEIELKNALTDEPENVQARLILGRVLYALGQLQSAEKELRRAAGLGAAPQEYAIMLGKVLRDQGKPEEVLALLNDTSGDLAGQEHERLILLGGAQLGVGQTEAGEASLLSAAAMKEDSAEAWILLARMAISTGDNETWNSRMKNALEAEPDSPGVWLEKAGVEVRMGRPADAEASYERALALTESEPESPSRVSALLGLADQAILAQDSARAQELVNRIADKFRQTPPVKLVQARLEVEKGNLDAAESVLNEVLGLVPGHRGALYYLAAVNLEQGKYVQAENRLAELLQADPSNLAARRLMVIARVKLDDPDKAAADMDSLLTSGFSDSYLTSLIGGELMRRGDIRRAVRYLRHSADASPDSPGIAMELALGLLAERQVPEAIEVLESVTAEGAQEARRHAMLALAYQRSGKSQQAAKAAKSALATDGIDARSMNLVGEYFAMAGDDGRAREILQDATQMDPEDPRSFFSLAVLSFRAGDKDGARAGLERVIEIDPGHTRALTALAQLAVESGESAEGLEYLRKANSSDPGALMPAMQLARLYVASGRADDASEVLAPALERFPNDERLLGLQASSEIAAGKPDQAAATLEKLLRQKPNDQDVLMQLAAAQSAAGLNSRAKDTLEQAIGFNRRNTRALLMLAIVENDLANQARSDQLLKEARTVEPGSPASYLVEGDILWKRGQMQAAYAAYLEAETRGSDRSLVLKIHRAAMGLGKADADRPLLDWLEKLPTDAGMRSVLAQYYLNKEMYEEAARQYATIVDAAPNNAPALNNLAWSAFKLGQPEARAYAQRALAASPDNPLIADTLGWILAGAGEYGEAGRLIREASQKAPRDADIAYHLAFVLAETGEVREARDILRRILAEDADFENRQEAEALLAKIK